MITSKQLHSEIDHLQENVDTMSKELDQLYRDFATILPSQVETWMRTHLKSQVDANAKEINVRGIEPLRQVKSDLEALVKRLPEICAAAIGQQETWPHHRKLTDEDQYPGLKESHAAGSFRTAISHLAPLLAKHGLIGTKQTSSQEWQRVSSHHFRYGFNPGFDERQIPVLETYNRKCAAMMDLKRMLKDKRKELELIRARELWDQA